MKGMYEMNYDNYFDLGSFSNYDLEPIVVNIKNQTLLNNNFRTTLWTGRHLQLTVMSIKPGEDIGLEIHPNVDQLIMLEQGTGVVKMGDDKDICNFEKNMFESDAVLIPAGKWHNIINIGDIPMKLCSVYAPPNHPKGTIHKTKIDADH